MLYLIGPDGLVNLSFENFQKNGVDDNGTSMMFWGNLQYSEGMTRGSEAQ